MSIDLVITVVAILILLFLSGLFSGSETALTAASRPRISHLEKQGNHRAKAVIRLLEARERLIGSILLGNNLVNILASALATSLLISEFGDAGVAYATVLMTALILIFSEVLPKTYALRHPIRTSLRVARFVGVTVTVLTPLIVAVEWVVVLTLRLFGAERGAQALLVSPQEELRSAIQLHTDEGGMVKHESDMLHGIFDLSKTSVEDVMIHRSNMTVIDAGQPSELVVNEVLSSPYTRLPIWRDDPENIVGVLHAKDVLRELVAVGGNGSAIDLQKIATEPWFIPETTTLVEQMAAFRARRQHFALVVDEYGALMGMVTLEDILEEIVGPIADEYDVSHRGIRAQPDGSVIVEGGVTIRDLNRDLGWSLPDEEAVTVAGIVIHESQSIPDVGQVFQYYNTRFEIVRRKRNQISLLRLTPLKKA
ncbi:MAG: HlyC/CorC family transporter [Proteobacteria bacterium]|nr:HlyC/CorC family transporter [Pseudomonadota bacterium]MDA1057465.1 HlyC/CorC family transporter [Pseudomonadota bacterium]